VAAGRDLILGYIPAGFGNATSHLLRLPRDPGELAEIIREGDARPIDLVAVDGHLALFAGAGWDALVADRYARTGARRLPGWARAVARSVPDLFRRPAVRVVADGRLVHEGAIELLVAGTTPFYGRGLRVNPGARPDRGRLGLRVYPGPAPKLALEAGRWALGIRPRARRVDAQEVEVETTDGSTLPVQADGDVVGEAPRWRFEVRPSAVRLIGRWVRPGPTA
jgi:diacylglycerol kinase (ATP)